MCHRHRCRHSQLAGLIGMAFAATRHAGARRNGLALEPYVRFTDNAGVSPENGGSRTKSVRKQEPMRSTPMGYTTKGCEPKAYAIVFCRSRRHWVLFFAYTADLRSFFSRTLKSSSALKILTVIVGPAAWCIAGPNSFVRWV